MLSLKGNFVFSDTKKAKLLLKYVKIYQKARRYACFEIIDGKPLPKIVKDLQRGIIPHEAICQEIVYWAQKLIADHTKRLNWYQTFLRTQNLENAPQWIKEEYDFFMNLETFEIPKEEMIAYPLGNHKIYYDGKEKKFFLDLRLSWRNLPVYWLENLEIVFPPKYVKYLQEYFTPRYLPKLKYVWTGFHRGEIMWDNGTLILRVEVLGTRTGKLLDIMEATKVKPITFNFDEKNYENNKYDDDSPIITIPIIDDVEEEFNLEQKQETDKELTQTKEETITKTQSGFLEIPFIDNNDEDGENYKFNPNDYTLDIFEVNEKNIDKYQNNYKDQYIKTFGKAIQLTVREEKKFATLLLSEPVEKTDVCILCNLSKKKHATIIDKIQQYDLIEIEGQVNDFIITEDLKFYVVIQTSSCKIIEKDESLRTFLAEREIEKQKQQKSKEEAGEESED